MLKNKMPALMIGLVLALLMAMTIAIIVGSVSITPSTVWRVIFSHMPFLGDVIEAD